MILQFPDLQTLQLALTSGTISTETAISPAKVAWAVDGSIWVDAEMKLSAASKNQLRSWGVTGRRSAAKAGSKLQDVRCWPQMIPVTREAKIQQTGDKTPVLFELPDESQLPDVVNEILRQGNDRQSFRTVVGDGDAGSRVLLRVLGPPYYSLLRALERRDDAADGIKAFVERSARVWIQVGYCHPLAVSIKPAAGQHLLIEPSGWRTLKEEPFRDVYEVLDFQLPSETHELKNTDDELQLAVPVGLVRGGSDDVAELFVLKKNAIEQLEQFVRSSSDEVIERLSFVVSQGGGQGSEDTTVVIRIRPGRTKPPVLVFDGVAYRRYLNISNLFVPIGLRVHPPLRRDAVKHMLAADDGLIVWVEPDVPEDVPQVSTSTPFAPCFVNDSAFRPLAQWVDYIIDRDANAMTAWKAAHQFDFEGFVCRDDQARTSTSKKSKKTAEKKSTTRKLSGKKSAGEASSSKETDSDSDGEPEDDLKSFKPPRKFKKTQDPTDAQYAEMQKQLKVLESEFLAADVALDDPSREPMWTQMAEANRAVSQFVDAGICHQHEIWEQQIPNVEALRAWFETEVDAARHTKTKLLPSSEGIVADSNLAKLLKTVAPSTNQVAQLASFVAWGCQNPTAADVIRSKQVAIQNFLEKHEGFLSVRTCWLAWSALANLSGDVLTLARVRDRMLNRLYQQGLTADRDLPSFLRMSGSQSGDRFRAVRGKVTELHDHVREWCRSNLVDASPLTLDYVDLIFSYAFARLGESSLSRKTLLAAGERLKRNSDDVHEWLHDAFEYRIKQSVGGQQASGPFPDALLERLDAIPKLARYKVDRLRQHSTILEPHEQLDPYRAWRRKNLNDLQNELSELFDVFSRSELLDRLKALFKRKLDPDNKARLITTALELSTRLGEKFAIKMLGYVVSADGKLSDTLLRASLLEKGLHISAHYDQAEFAHACLERMHKLIDGQGKADVATLEALESLLSRSFSGLRKLGMREEIATLLDRMTKQVRPTKAKAIEPERMRVLLQLAGGWFYFGQDRGWKDIDAARSVLLSTKLTSEGHVGAKKQTDLAVAYIRAVGQAPLNDAVDRLFELFDKLRGIHDSATVNTHYSLKQLDIVDALVQTIVSDSFTMNKESQRWLDDEEFLIRRRIHRDVRQMMP